MASFQPCPSEAPLVRPLNLKIQNFNQPPEFSKEYIMDRGLMKKQIVIIHIITGQYFIGVEENAFFYTPKLPKGHKSNSSLSIVGNSGMSQLQRSSGN